MKDVETEVRLRMLEMNSARLDLVLRAIFTTLTAAQREAAMSTLTALGVSEFAQSDRTQDDEDRLKGIRAHLEVLRALHASGDQAGIAVAMQAVLFLQTPEGQREAQKSWIETASVGELADDLSEALRTMPRLPPEMRSGAAAPATTGKGTAARKKKRGG